MEQGTASGGRRRFPSLFLVACSLHPSEPSRQKERVFAYFRYTRPRHADFFARRFPVRETAFPLLLSQRQTSGRSSQKQAFFHLLLMAVLFMHTHTQPCPCSVPTSLLIVAHTHIHISYSLLVRILLDLPCRTKKKRSPRTPKQPRHPSHRRGTTHPYPGRTTSRLWGRRIGS